VQLREARENVAAQESGKVELQAKLQEEKSYLQREKGAFSHRACHGQRSSE
jgi:hypothetical protein